MKKNYDDLTRNELNTILKDLQQEQRQLHFDKVISTVHNTAKFKTVRREIARIYTILSERDKGLRNEPVIGTLTEEKDTSKEKVEKEA